MDYLKFLLPCTNYFSSRTKIIKNKKKDNNDDGRVDHSSKNTVLRLIRTIRRSFEEPINVYY